MLENAASASVLINVQNAECDQPQLGFACPVRPCTATLNSWTTYRVACSRPARCACFGNRHSWRAAALSSALLPAVLPVLSACQGTSLSSPAMAAFGTRAVSSRATPLLLQQPPRFDCDGAPVLESGIDLRACNCNQDVSFMMEPSARRCASWACADGVPTIEMIASWGGRIRAASASGFGKFPVRNRVTNLAGDLSHSAGHKSSAASHLSAQQ